MFKKEYNFEKVLISILLISFIIVILIMVLIKFEIFKDIKKELLNSNRFIQNISEPAYVPNEFSYVEGDINTGYVIQDSHGNQFVWVPVDDNKVKIQRFNFNKQKDFKDYFDNTTEFLNSVQKYKGFYVARYEAGKENNVLVSKNNVNVWNNILYDEAVELCQNMYDFLQHGIYSNIINSYAWDTIMLWTSDITNLNNNTISYLYNSNDMGNYTGSIKKTGSLENYKIKNIYDLAGNVSELTTERIKGSDKIHVSRGGMYVIPAENMNVVSRIPNNNTTYETTGFRVILYK